MSRSVAPILIRNRSESDVMERIFSQDFSCGFLNLKTTSLPECARVPRFLNDYFRGSGFALEILTIILTKIQEGGKLGLKKFGIAHMQEILTKDLWAINGH